MRGSAPQTPAIRGAFALRSTACPSGLPFWGTVYEQIDIKRKALGIDKARERVLYDMEMRRDLT